jgi:hypothetical protein
LREAILAANADAAYADCPAGDGADVVALTVAGAIVLGSALPVLAEGLTLAGLGAAASTIDGGGAHRLLSLPGPANGQTDLLRIEGVRLTGGLGTDGGAVGVGADRALEVVDCVVENNVADDFGGGISGRSASSVRIERSLLSGNLAAGRDGGGVSATFSGSLEIVDSTIAGNATATASGGGIFAYFVDQLLVRRSTLSGNVAGDHGGGLEFVGGQGALDYVTVTGNLADGDGDDSGWGGGVEVVGTGATLALFDSVVADNVDASAADADCPDLSVRLRGELITAGFNLVGVNDCGTAAFPPGLPNGNADFVGTSAAPLEALLGPLADHGGPTPTHLPLEASPAVDQGSCPGEVADQRGFSDPVTQMRAVDLPEIANLDDGCDIGAVERHPEPPPGLPFVDGFESGDAAAWSSVTP